MDWAKRLREDKRLGKRGWHRVRKKQEKGEENISFFPNSPFPQLRRQIYSLGLGRGGEHKEDRSAVLPSECLGT